MKKILGLFIGVILVLTLAVSVHAAGGFDQYGYNDQARVFVGPADGVDKVLDGKIWGGYETYANDHLVMRWNAAWDACNANPTPENCQGAWTDNEWNGMVPNGSGETWHYKIVWIGSCGADYTPMSNGGYCIWGQYEMILSQGTAGGEHFWDVLAKPAGYGAY
nr:hypothetical protein [Candidatus Levybacteria bacterium]